MLNPGSVGLIRCSDRNLPHNTSYYRSDGDNNCWMIKLRQNVHNSEVRVNIFTPFSALGTVVVNTQEEFLQALCVSGYAPAIKELRNIRINNLVSDDTL